MRTAVLLLSSLALLAGCRGMERETPAARAATGEDPSMQLSAHQASGPQGLAGPLHGAAVRRIEVGSEDHTLLYVLTKGDGTDWTVEAANGETAVFAQTAVDASAVLLHNALAGQWWRIDLRGGLVEIGDKGDSAPRATFHLIAAH